MIGTLVALLVLFAIAYFVFALSAEVVYWVQMRRLEKHNRLELTEVRFPAHSREHQQ